MSGKRIIITGQSGLKIGDAMASFCRDVPTLIKGMQEPHYSKLEAVMTGFYCAQRQKEKYDTIWMDEILKLPLRDLQALWNTALEHLLSQLW